MADLLASGTEVKTEAVGNWHRGVTLLALICGKLALVGLLLWICIRALYKISQQTRLGGTTTARTAREESINVSAGTDARRRLAWEREQKRLDEIAAAALAEKQERIKLQQDTRTAALVVREAKERSRSFALKADEARMRRRRAEDQLKLSSDADDEHTVQILRQDAEKAARKDQEQRNVVQQAVSRLEELRRTSKLKEG